MADAADQYAESINQATRSLLPDEVLHGEPMQCIVLALIALLVGTTSSLRREGCDVAPHGVTPPPTHQSYLTPLIETTNSARCRFKLPYNELIATTYDSAAAPASPPTPSSAWSPGSQAAGQSDRPLELFPIITRRGRRRDPRTGHPAVRMLHGDDVSVCGRHWRQGADDHHRRGYSGTQSRH